MQYLFVYGTLAPNRPNAHVLADVLGTWAPAVVMGRLRQAGWGAGMGYPGMDLDDAGEPIAGYVLASDVLDQHWQRIDGFEGSGYERVLTQAKLDDGTTVSAHVYVLRA